MLKVRQSVINRAMKVKDITLYICLDEENSNWVSWDTLGTEEELGEFTFILEPTPSIGDDVLITPTFGNIVGDDKEEGCYEIWKIIHITYPCIGTNEGSMVMKFISSTCYIPGDY